MEAWVGLSAIMGWLVLMPRKFVGKSQRNVWEIINNAERGRIVGLFLGVKRGVC